MNRACCRLDRRASIFGWHGAVGLPFRLAPIACILLTLHASVSLAQQTTPARNSSPQQTLVAALSAACRQNAQEFSPYLLTESRHAFLSLPAAEQKSLLKRFSLTSMVGNPRALLDTNGRLVVQCRTPAETVTFGLSPAKLDRNVAFVPVAVSGGDTTETTDFGLVHQPDGWRLFSLGLLVINVPALVQQWENAAMQANQQAAMSDLFEIAQAIRSYQSTFGKWPDTLAQLGPAAPSPVSPEHAQLLSKKLASGTADGYRFRFRIVVNSNGQIQGFELGAVPNQYDKTGRQSFFLDEEGKLHAADNHGAPATSSDPIVTPPSQSSS
jgi:type II secretory pathway pseudopilin PulG